MRTLIVGVGGMTNGGKTTLSQRLNQQIPHSCVIAQDMYFKDDSVVPVDSNGFKQYDMLSALHMDKMMSDVNLWRKDPEAFLKDRSPTRPVDNKVYLLIVEGFLIFNYGPLNELLERRYFIEIPYDVCKTRRSLRVYVPPDPPGYFQGHVWPMYLKNRKEMESAVSGIVFLDGLQSKEELLAVVYKDVIKNIQEIKERNEKD